MDLPRLFAMDRYWVTHPPLRDMVQAAFFGPIEAKDRPRATATGEPHENTEKDLENFVDMFSSVGGTVT
jgi:hypothetical protein